MDRVTRRYTRTEHSFGPLLLWPPGWQVGTRYADEPIYDGARGRRREPGRSPGSTPMSAPSSTSRTARRRTYADEDPARCRSRRSGSAGCTGSGFVFPDVEAVVEEEFEKTLQFALDLARSADDPRIPSAVGIETSRSTWPGRGRPGERRRGRLRHHRSAIRRGEGGSRRAPRPRRRPGTASTAGARTRVDVGVAQGEVSGYGDEAHYRTTDARQVTRHRCRRPRGGVVSRPAATARALVHLQGGVRLEQADVLVLRRRTTRASRLPALPRGSSRLPVVLPAALDGQAIPYDIYDWTLAAAGPRTARRAQPLRRGALVHAERQRDRARAPIRRRAGIPESRSAALRRSATS